jgi:hypothetical protein
MCQDYPRLQQVAKVDKKLTKIVHIRTRPQAMTKVVKIAI